MENTENEILKEMAEHSDEVFFIYNLKNKCFDYVNAAFENITKRSIHEVYNKPSSLFKIIHKDDRQNIKENFEYLLESKTNTLLDFRILRPDKTERWLRMKVYPIIIEDKVKYITGFVEDDSARKLNVLNMEKINGWKDSTLEILAHDLRGPIGIVKLLASSIVCKISECENKQISEWAKMIENISKRNLNLIKDLIKKENLDTAGVEISKEKVDVIQEINEIINIYKQSHHSLLKQLQLTHSHDKLYARIDSMKFLQIINNLISNAIKFTTENGVIKVHVEDMETSFVVTVSDNGIGIPKDLQLVLFDKYTKAARSGLDGQESIGLGMWIIRSFTEAHGGRIWLESDEDTGSKFYLEFPKGI